MKVSTEDVQHVAHLARLSVGEGEIAEYRQDLEKILDLMAELRVVKTDGIRPFLNPVREMRDGDTLAAGGGRADEVGDSLHRDLVLSNAPDSRYGQFKLQAVIESGAES